MLIVVANPGVIGLPVVEIGVFCEVTSGVDGDVEGEVTSGVVVGGIVVGISVVPSVVISVVVSTGSVVPGERVVCPGCGYTFAKEHSTLL